MIRIFSTSDTKWINEGLIVLASSDACVSNFQTILWLNLGWCLMFRAQRRESMSKRIVDPICAVKLEVSTTWTSRLRGACLLGHSLKETNARHTVVVLTDVTTAWRCKPLYLIRRRRTLTDRGALDREARVSGCIFMESTGAWHLILQSCAFRWGGELRTIKVAPKHACLGHVLFDLMLISLRPA